MNRKTFIKTCGLACVGGSVLPMLGCSSIKYVNGELKDNGISIPVTAFETKKGDTITFKKHVVVQHAKLQYPIYVTRFSHTDYRALLMQCSHQGNELSAYGDRLQCPAHGSEFDSLGVATSGPATQTLRSFPITIDNNIILISLST